MPDLKPQIVIYVASSLHRGNAPVNDDELNTNNGYREITPLYLAKGMWPDAHYLACVPEGSGIKPSQLFHEEMFADVFEYAQDPCEMATMPPPAVSPSLKRIIEAVPYGDLCSNTITAVISPYCLFCDPQEFKSAWRRFQTNNPYLVATCQEADPHPWEMLRFHNQNGIAKNSLPVCFEGLWTVDFEHFRLIHPSDGSPIFRRQDFPDFFQLNYGLIIARKKDLLDINDILKRSDGHLFPCSNTVLIKSRLDFIKALVRAKAFGHWAEEAQNHPFNLGS